MENGSKCLDLTTCKNAENGGLKQIEESRCMTCYCFKYNFALINSNEYVLYFQVQSTETL